MGSGAKVQTNMRLDRGLLERVDAVRGGVSRTAWFEEAARLRLAGGVGEGSVVSGVGAGERKARYERALRVLSSAEWKAGRLPIPKGEGKR